MNRKWLINGRFRIPIWAEWFGKLIPQPRWLRRWYYEKSFDWWGHPGNHHWKGCHTANFGSILRPGERDIWSGGYMSGSLRERLWREHQVLDNMEW